LHEAQNGKGRVLKQNYLIIRNIKGKDIIIIDDILTTKHSVADYKEEIKRCSGKVVAAIFYGKTFFIPHCQKSIWREYFID
jgi:orotate phosphoribosyltransferase-like protein